MNLLVFLLQTSNFPSGRPTPNKKLSLKNRILGQHDQKKTFLCLGQWKVFQLWTFSKNNSSPGTSLRNNVHWNYDHGANGVSITIMLQFHPEWPEAGCLVRGEDKLLSIRYRKDTSFIPCLIAFMRCLLAHTDFHFMNSDLFDNWHTTTWQAQAYVSIHSSQF